MVHWPSEIFFNWFLTHWPQTKPGWRWSHFFAVERITKLIGIPEKWGPCGDIGGWRIHWAIRNGNPMDFSLENAWEKSLWLINLNLPAPTEIRVLFETETGLGLGVFWSAAPLIHHPFSTLLEDPDTKLSRYMEFSWVWHLKIAAGSASDVWQSSTGGETAPFFWGSNMHCCHSNFLSKREKHSKC